MFLQDEDLFTTLNKQMEEDRKIVISRSNLHEMHKVVDFFIFYFFIFLTFHRNLGKLVILPCP